MFNTKWKWIQYQYQWQWQWQCNYMCDIWMSICMDLLPLLRLGFLCECNKLQTAVFVGKFWMFNAKWKWNILENAMTCMLLDRDWWNSIFVNMYAVTILSVVVKAWCFSRVTYPTCHDNVFFSKDCHDIAFFQYVMRIFMIYIVYVL